MVDSHTQSIRVVLEKNGIDNSELADHIWHVLYSLDEGDEDEGDEKVSGEERRDLRQLQKTAVRVAGKIDGLETMPFTARNANFLNELISALGELEARIEERLSEPSRERKNPTSPVGRKRIQIYNLLRDAGIKLPMSQYSLMIAEIFIAVTNDEGSGRENLQKTIYQQLRNLKT